MRRLLTLGLALPAALLAACSEGPTVVDPETTASPTEAGDDGATSGPDEATATSGPDQAGATAQREPTRAERGAARRAEQWLVAFVRGRDEVCDYMLDLSGEGPMSASDSDYAICVDMIPPLAQQQFDEDTARVIELVEITGADVDGDRAVVDRDHFSELFAEGIGDQQIQLRRVEGAWYVDLENSF